MSEQLLRDKLKKVDASFNSPGTPGEKEAARLTATRIGEKTGVQAVPEPLRQYRISISNEYMRRVFISLCHRCGGRLVRSSRMKKQTVVFQMSPELLSTTFWPEYVAMRKELHGQLHKLTEKVIRESVQACE